MKKGTKFFNLTFFVIGFFVFLSTLIMRSSYLERQERIANWWQYCDPRACVQPSFGIELADCNATVFQALVGLTPKELKQKYYPANTNIYNANAKPISQFTKNRLNIEMGQNHVVKRVYCS